MVNLKKPFKNCYYLCEDGTIYNSETEKTVKPDKKHRFYLWTEEGNKKYISQRKLYRQLYNKEYCINNIDNLENEQWKEVIGTKGKYFVSNQGRIKSYQRYKAAILKPYTNQGGYLRVDIDIEGSRRSVLVHRLVAAAFLSLPERIDLQLHHKDFDKKNNAADNLEWLTATEHGKKHSERRTKENVCTKSKEDLH